MKPFFVPDKADRIMKRDDVAYTLALLANRPDAAGLAIDLNGGNDDIGAALDSFIEKGSFGRQPNIMFISKLVLGVSGKSWRGRGR